MPEVTPELIRDGITNWRRKTVEQQEPWKARAQRHANRTGNPIGGAHLYLADYVNRKLKAGA